MDKLFLILETQMRLSDDLKNALKSVISVRRVRKGELLVQNGKICNHLFFIRKGALRGYHYQQGKEITAWFGFENDFATSTYSFVAQKEGYENIEAIENCILYSISYQDLNQVYRLFPEFNYAGRLLTEKYYLDLLDRTLMLQYQTARESYEQLIKSHPHILKRASLGHIASYLGISQETLSRIRTK